MFSSLHGQAARVAQQKNAALPGPTVRDCTSKGSSAAGPE
jgi:hypothetical protein